ncbi:MAG: hypothetical protein J1F38_03865 [Muribaculaceae bacterium]|nr:hypothetical protein [Muribaculaceae bacterium]
MINTKNIRLIIYPQKIQIGISIIVLLFFYLFPIRFPFIPLSSDYILAVVGLFLFLIKRTHIPYYISNYYSLISLLFIFSLFSKVYNQSFDFYPEKQIILWYIYPLAVYPLFILLDQKKIKITPDKFFFFIIICFDIQGILSLVIFFNDTFREIFLNYFGGKEIDKLEHFGSFRLLAIAKPELQYANMAIMYGLASFACLINIKTKNRFNFSICSLILFLICGVLSGRSYFIVFGLSIFIISYEFIKKNLLNIIKLIIYVFVFFLILIIIFLYFYKNNDNNTTFLWAFEIFINLIENGNLDFQTGEVMKSMYIFPDKISTYLIGDNRISNGFGGTYMDTDIGYIRFLFCWGIIGSLLLYSIQIYKLFTLRKINNLKEYNNFYLLLFLILFIYLSKDLYSIFNWIILIYYINYRKHKNKNIYLSSNKYAS